MKVGRPNISQAANGDCGETEHTTFLQQVILEDKPHFFSFHMALPDLIQKYPMY